MAYGLKYQTQFDSQSDDNNPIRRYTLQFLFKDYTGINTSIDGGNVSVKQKCTDDNPFSPIRGQSLDIELINDGNIPITAFQSEDDDGVMVKLLDENSNILYIGFLVQDDFYEVKVDYSHAITLSANDSLGLLKGVILSEAEVRRGFTASFRTNGVDTVVYVYTADSSFYPQAGNTIELLGTAYTIVTAVDEDTVIGIATYNWTITVTPTTGGISQTVDTIYLTGSIDLRKRNTILSVIALCLGQTNISVLLNIYYNLYEYTQDQNKSTFEQTLLDTQLFINGETYDNCYDVLTKVMTAFRCTIFQANGQWNIVSWDEFRLYTSNAVPGFIYDETYLLIGTSVFSNSLFIGPDPQLTQPLYELTEGAMRGYKFSRKTFNYKQPKYLLPNYDFQTIGDLIRTYVDGAFTFYDYEAPGWQGGVGPILCERFIRVKKDGAGNEIQRFLVARGNCSNATQAVGSDPIEISEGDKLTFSFTFRTNISQPGLIQIIFAVKLTDGNLIRYVDEVPTDNGSWISTVGFNYTIAAGDNSNTAHTVEIMSSQAPFSGLVTVFLAIATDTPYNNSRETYYSDVRFEVIPYINDSTKVIGHIHKQEQIPNKKLNNDVEIYIDDTPRNSIAGTLFLKTVTGLLQDRTTVWRHPTDGINGWRLGERNTLNEITWRQKTRSKLEGDFTGLWQNGVPISLLAMGITDFNPTKNYTFGLLNIDYKNNIYRGTLWEIFDTEDDTGFLPTYTFTYIYSTT